jgi:hypothetical protein
VRLLFTALAFALLLTPVASRQLTAIRVSEGDDLQAKINAAKPGDVILLAAGARFTGNFVLPVHGDTPAFITIRTDADGLPTPGVRTGPDASGRLAVLQSPTNMAVLRTAPGAHHWRIENVEFRGNAGGYGDIIALGHGGGDQRRREDVPHTIVLDRVYIQGDPLLGQKRGIALNSASTEIINSYIADIKAVGQDSQAIAGWNGPGPYTIVNNYLEAAGENILFGGGDPMIEGLVPQDIVIRGNHIARPVSWRQPIVALPADVVAAPARAASEDAAAASQEPARLQRGSYSYRIVAIRRVASGADARSLPSSPVTVDVPDETSAVTVRWSPVDHATRYRVYRRDGSANETWWEVKEPVFTDDGRPGKVGAPPKNATRWSVKNLLELKNARNVEIDGNTFEFNWVAAQDGYALLFKPVNQGGRALWATIENVRVINNVIRHVAAAININGTDTGHRSSRARGITIENNLFVDVSRARWGGTGDFIKIGNAPADLVIQGNTIMNDGRIMNVYGGKGGTEASGFVFRRNVVRHNRYGVKGPSTATGRATLAHFFPGATFTGNVIGGGRAAAYPDGNRVIAAEDFDLVFIDAATGDYRLRPPYSGVGADVSTLGAAIAARTSATAAPATLQRSSN